MVSALRISAKSHSCCQGRSGSRRMGVTEAHVIERGLERLRISELKERTRRGKAGAAEITECRVQ